VEKALATTNRRCFWKLSFSCITLLEQGESVMAAKALVQTRIDVDVKEQATQVLENMGLTVSDAVRILLTRTAKEGRCQSNS
jgi:hypothetical protein